VWRLEALSEGERNFTNLAIAVDTQTLTPPCGTCRQIIWEFAKHADIVMVNLRDERETVHIENLLPPLTPAFLKKSAAEVKGWNFA